MVFNREYQRRAARQALARIGFGVARDPNSGFYRPAKRTNPKPEKKNIRGPEQLALNFDADRPLADLIPEAYE